MLQHMNRKTITYLIWLAMCTVTISQGRLHAGDPKPFARSQAVQLLTSMGYKDVRVGAIVHGFAPMTGSQNVATVVAIGHRDGKLHKLERHFFYDDEIGWFSYEYDGSEMKGTPTTKLRMWTLSGYREVRPKLSLTDAEITEKMLGSWTHTATALRYTKDGRWTQKTKDGDLTGTWKIEQGVMISSIATSALESLKAGTRTEWEILIVDDTKLQIKGSQGEITYNRDPASQYE
jgi:hypothetical protein